MTSSNATVAGCAPAASRAEALRSSSSCRSSPSPEVAMLEERHSETRRPARAEGQLPSAHVLVVDDEHSIRHFVQCALADAGYQVTMAANGQEAMSKFKSEVPDLVVLDVK